MKYVLKSDWSLVGGQDVKRWRSHRNGKLLNNFAVESINSPQHERCGKIVLYDRLKI